jgi:hypothetical protein
MDHSVDAQGEGPIDHRAIRDGPDNRRIGARRYIETDNGMALAAQPWREKAAEPAGRSGEEDAHERRLSFGGVDWKPPEACNEATRCRNRRC